MTRIRWTTEAADQFEAIVNHIREDNPEAARVLAQTILDRIAGLEKFPPRPGNLWVIWGSAGRLTEESVEPTACGIKGPLLLL